MKTIGLIGGVASGKSTVAGVLKSFGAKVLDADRLGHETLELREIQEKLVLRWGGCILTPDSTVENRKISRNEVAKIVFGGDDQSAGELKWLESVTHPVIGQKMEQQIRKWRLDGETIAALLDAPILLKAGWDHFCDEILFVDCPAETRWLRASKRGWTRQQWEDRENRQTPLEQKRAKATFIVNNSLPLSDVQKELERFWEEKIVLKTGS